MGDAALTGEIDAKHFLIAIIAIVAIVALAFTVVYATGGLRGAAFYSLTGGNPYANENVVTINWECFNNCLESRESTPESIEICKQVCS